MGKRKSRRNTTTNNKNLKYEQKIGWYLSISIIFCGWFEIVRILFIHSNANKIQGGILSFSNLTPKTKKDDSSNFSGKEKNVPALEHPTVDYSKNESTSIEMPFTRSISLSLSYSLPLSLVFNGKYRVETSIFNSMSTSLQCISLHLSFIQFCRSR